MVISSFVLMGISLVVILCIGILILGIGFTSKEMGLIYLGIIITIVAMIPLVFH